MLQSCFLYTHLSLIFYIIFYFLLFYKLISSYKEIFKNIKQLSQSFIFNKITINLININLFHRDSRINNQYCNCILLSLTIGIEGVVILFFL
ncbi:hypothetical protein XSR1_60040 [Xenorhabdus szentirmaii DSM 16338]|uniref:Uncharacterized protein n=1 Tax=Xenorhabdus szentirmaii DSM 16338 TaxID=1427518 RepID=W1J2M7_9GAMM|nr:hypothetical protein XSR1_60040 [Xenorhabdus szentirmaii DSM 16338]